MTKLVTSSPPPNLDLVAVMRDRMEPAETVIDERLAMLREGGTEPLAVLMPVEREAAKALLSLILNRTLDQEIRVPRALLVLQASLNTLVHSIDGLRSALEIPEAKVAVEQQMHRAIALFIVEHAAILQLIMLVTRNQTLVEDMLYTSRERLDTNLPLAMLSDVVRQEHARTEELRARKTSVIGALGLNLVQELNKRLAVHTGRQRTFSMHYDGGDYVIINFHVTPGALAQRREEFQASEQLLRGVIQECGLAEYLEIKSSVGNAAETEAYRLKHEYYAGKPAITDEERYAYWKIRLLY